MKTETDIRRQIADQQAEIERKATAEHLVHSPLTIGQAEAIKELLYGRQ